MTHCWNANHFKLEMLYIWLHNPLRKKGLSPNCNAPGKVDTLSPNRLMIWFTEFSRAQKPDQKWCTETDCGVTVVRMFLPGTRFLSTTKVSLLQFLSQQWACPMNNKVCPMNNHQVSPSNLDGVIEPETHLFDMELDLDI